MPEAQLVPLRRNFPNTILARDQIAPQLGDILCPGVAAATPTMAMSRLANCLTLSPLCGDLFSRLIASLLAGLRKEERRETCREGGAIETTGGSASGKLS